MASRGSEEEDAGDGERLVVWRLGLGGLVVVDLRFGLRERVRSRCRLYFLCFEEWGDRDRDRDREDVRQCDVRPACSRSLWSLPRGL